MEVFDYAMIENGDTKVINIIVADEGFLLEGYYLVKINDGEYVVIGMTYNKESGMFS